MAKFDGSGSVLFNGKKVNSGDILNLDQYEPSIVYDGASHLYLCWSDERNSQPDIYAQKYDKTGARIWAGGDVKINDDTTPCAWRTKPSLAYCGNEAIYFSWQDDRNGDNDIYSAKFDSDGNKLWIYDLIMNSDSSLQFQNSPGVVTDLDGYAITVWEDFRNGSDYDIYAARYKDLGIFPRVNVPIIVTGEKLKGTYPFDCVPPDCLPIYKYDKEFASDESGRISIGDGASEIEFDDYSFAAGGGYTVISTDQSEPLTVIPGSAEAVVINVEP